MNRRAFVRVAAGSLLGISLAAIGQQTKARRVGWLWNEPPGTIDEVHKAYPTHLRALGWAEGQNILVDRRYSSGKVELLKPLAEELVRLQPNLIVAEGTIATLAVRTATSTIPIVFSRSGDPVAAGLVASIARPGGNITGTSTLSLDLDKKRAELIHELLPGAVRVGEPIVSANPINRTRRSEYERAYRTLGIQPIFVEVSRADELEGSIDELARQGVQILRINPEPLLGTNFSIILRAAQKHSLPVIVEDRNALEAGALISYGPDQLELDHQLASIVDRILRGAKPADLPVRQPTKFELLINLKTARSLGLTIPQSLLLRASELVQ